jgi:hypothetical protein
MPPVFRKTVDVIPHDQKDFELRPKVDRMDNPKALSAFDKYPRFHEDKRRASEALTKEKRMLSGLRPWERHHPLNHRYVPFSTQPERKPASTQHLHGATVANFKK